MSKPLVTIVTPSYNQGRFIEATILSVLNQTYPNIQYIVIDGGSTDQTMTIVEKYKDQIDVIIHEKDEGQADAISKGFKRAKGELVGWINSDDILYSACVEEIVKCYRSKSDGAIYYSSLLDWIDEKGEKFSQKIVQIKDRKFLLNSNYVLIQQGSFYSRKFVERINYLDINNYYCMDLALWLDLLQFGPIYHPDIEKPLAAFRVYRGTKTDTGQLKFLKNIKKVLLEKGASKWSYNILIKIYFYTFKYKVKSFLWRH